MRLFPSVGPTTAEVAADRAGDDLIPSPDVVMDRAFTINASPEEIWPWLVQFGKQRAGWYLARRVERFIPPSRRALRTIDPKWQDLKVGDVILDYGGKNETFQSVVVDRPDALVYKSQRGRASMTWSIVLHRDAVDNGTRVSFRLRMAPIKRPWLAESLGELLDMLTIAGMAAGLRERLVDDRNPKAAAG